MIEKGLFYLSHGDGTIGFYPIDGRGHEICKEVGEGGKVLLWVHKARYPEHHRFAMLVFHKIAEATGSTTDAVYNWLKDQTGRFDFVKNPDGTMDISRHSLKFESMGQDEFQKFWTEALEVIKEKVLPNIDEATFNEIRDMIAGKVEA